MRGNLPVRPPRTLTHSSKSMRAVLSDAEKTTRILLSKPMEDLDKCRALIEVGTLCSRGQNGGEEGWGHQEMLPGGGGPPCRGSLQADPQCLVQSRCHHQLLTFMKEPLQGLSCSDSGTCPKSHGAGYAGTAQPALVGPYDNFCGWFQAPNEKSLKAGWEENIIGFLHTPARGSRRAMEPAAPHHC